MPRTLTYILLLGLVGCSKDAADDPADADLDAATPDAQPQLPDAAPDAPPLPDAAEPDAPPPPPPVLSINEVDCRDDDGVELVNLGGPADLEGWTVAGTPLEGTLDADAFGWFATRRIICGDPVKLVAPDGTEVDETVAPLAVEAATWGRLPDADGDWDHTRPTPGAPNAPFVAPAEDLFDLTVRHIDLTVQEEGYTVLLQSPRERVDVVVTVEEDAPVAGQVRVTGRSGRFKAVSQKPSLTLHFDDAPLRGLRTLELDALTLDPAVVTRRLAWRVLSAAGIAMPRIGFAWVRINDEDYGLYAVAEVRDADFLARHYTSSAHLFAASGRDVIANHVWRFDVELGLDQRPELERLAALPDEDFYGASTDYVRWDEVVRALAAEVWMGSVDGYGPARRAVWLHFDALGRLATMPGGTDHAFRRAVPAQRGPARLLARCLDAPGCRTAYASALLEIAQALTGMAWSIDDEVDTVRPWVEMDPRSLASVEMFDLEVERIRAFLGPRAGRMLAYAECLNAGHEDCDDGSGPNCSGRPDDDETCGRCVEMSRGGQTYHVCPTRVNWASAQALCVRLGADLFVPDSRGESDWVHRHALSVARQDYWIGLSDREEEGVFAWVDGAEREFAFWADGEPNDSGDGEDCAHLRGDGRWNDGVCGGRLGVVCESACDAAEVDADEDGAGGCGVDCDDEDPERHPAATDVCGDGINQNCSGSADDQDCTCTAVWRGERRYLLCPAGITFEEARTLCQAEDMDLAIVDDAEENTWLWQVATQRRSQRWWIGVSDLVTEGHYRWWDGTKPRFHAWSRGEPNDSGRREDCGHFWDGSPTWNDIPCDARQGTICEETL